MNPIVQIAALTVLLTAQAAAEGPADLATAQAELQFGFLGAPQLGLIAQFGLGLSYATVSRTDEQVPSGNRRVSSTTTNSTGQFNLGTTIGNYSLADIISGSLSAVWYFGGSPSR
jgi:hypothetical protein